MQLRHSYVYTYIHTYVLQSLALFTFYSIPNKSEVLFLHKEMKRYEYMDGLWSCGCETIVLSHFYYGKMNIFNPLNGSNLPLTSQTDCRVFFRAPGVPDWKVWKLRAGDFENLIVNI
jgi:hypothetical protein